MPKCHKTGKGVKFVLLLYLPKYLALVIHCQVTNTGYLVEMHPKHYLLPNKYKSLFQ